MARSVLMDPAVKEIAAVDVEDLRVLQQKRDRFERCLNRVVSFGTFVGAAKDLLRATDIILTEHLPAAEPEKETA